MQAISYLTVLPSTADEIKRFSSQIIQQVKEGEENPLRLLVLLRALESTAETIRKGIETEIISEADRYSEKRFQAYGATIEKSELGTKYKYEASGDPEWARRKAGVDAAMNLLKEREAFLRSLRESITIVVEETGEVVNVMPPPKISTSGLKVFL